ncbi:GGDEF domain-containing protein [Tsukamurella ocularis]|uniref:GGDEF domain-containing protein n=1 Tax=Tsukamurella ocularis TaxID=1970234 RepID=UPI0021682DE0|nr:GGDEF domain-containing protein [Tsukamurella ocularis]MCS3779857.1 diguanylate cyclase (GGDEF)-like protein [Tsukamurella ocularis]MCS3788743.1 diguanylate cyclase (GGDEF)-like protein [Tsukamurella ocularis]MCS3849953.1 diguanylate cyclase (GGDEF)-like protein [Tsukamurella ocularis]
MFARAVKVTWRALVEDGQWRDAGRREYDLILGGIRAHGGMLAMRVVVGALGIIASTVGVILMLHPDGPKTLLGRTLLLGGSAGGFVLGGWWISTERPSARQALVFLAAADVSIVVAVAGFARADTRIVLAGALAMLGTFAGFFLGWRILLVHCLFAAFATIGFTIAAVLQGSALLDVLPAYLVITLLVGLMPASIQLLIEPGRRSVFLAVEQRDRDPLTGLYNRRGFARAARAMIRDRTGATFVVATIDLDDLKGLNDASGHAAGDRILVGTADALRAGPGRFGTVGRAGGDEFLFCAAPSSSSEVRMCLVELHRFAADVPHRLCVGISVANLSDSQEFARAMTDADGALYGAKRSASDAVVIHDRRVD